MSLHTRQKRSYKVCMFGPVGSGKTTLTQNIIHGHARKPTPTIGAIFETKNVLINGQVSVVQIWDTAGQERYMSLLPMYLRNADIIIFVKKPNISKRELNLWTNLLPANTPVMCVTTFADTYTGHIENFPNSLNCFIDARDLSDSQGVWSKLIIMIGDLAMSKEFKEKETIFYDTLKFSNETTENHKKCC